MNFSPSCTQKKKIDLQKIPQTTKARSKIGANKLLIIFLRYPIVISLRKMSNSSWNLRLAWKKRKEFFYNFLERRDVTTNEWWKSERNKERMYEFTWCAIVTCERYRRNGDKNVNERSFDMDGSHWENIDRNMNRIRNRIIPIFL